MSQFLKTYFLQICLGIGLGLQLFHTSTYFTYQGSDRNLQILGGINLMIGEGYSVQEAFLEDLSQVAYQPLKGWPPGYSILLIPLYKLTGDIFLSAEILAYLAIIICFSGAHFFLNYLRPHIHKWVYPSFFLLWGISFTPFHFTAFADEWALGFFLWGTFCWFKVWNEPEERWLLFSLLGILFFWLAGFMRYAYYPIMGLPIMMTGIRWWRGEVLNWRKEIFSGLLQIFAFAILWTVSTPMVGTVNSLTDVSGQNSIYWENLKWMDAFPIKTFFYLSVDGISNKLGGISVYLSLLLKVGMFFFSAFLLALPVFRLRNKDLVPSDERKFIIYILAVTGIIVSMLIYLSLKAPTDFFGQFAWTYVRETRFYAPVLGLLQILFLHFCFQNPFSGWKKWGLKIFVIIGVCYSLGHSVYRYSQRYILGNFKETRYSLEDQRLKALYDTIDSLVEDEKPLIWVYEEGIYPEDEAAVVRWKGYSAILIDKLIKGGIESQKPVTLLLKIKKKNLNQLLEREKKTDSSKVKELIISEPDTLYLIDYDPPNSL